MAKVLGKGVVFCLRAVSEFRFLLRIPFSLYPPSLQLVHSSVHQPTRVNPGVLAWARVAAGFLAIFHSVRLLQQRINGRSPRLSFAMRILLAAFLLPAVVALKTCVVDAKCDVCGPEEALFPIASSPFADTGICVSKKRWRPTRLKLSSPTATETLPILCPRPISYNRCLPPLVGASRHL